VRLAKLIDRTKGLRFCGVMGYEGHCVNEPDPELRRAKTTRANDLVKRGARLIEEAGIPVEVVSGGGTGTYDITGTHPAFTEVQAGSYVAMDVCYHRLRPEFGIALSVLCTVVSRRARGRGVIDGGLKTFSKGFDVPAAKNRPGVKVAYLSEEHGSLILSGKGSELKIGDKLEFYTAHCCEAFNLHDRVYGVRKGKVETEWQIAARGRLT
jgi:D-serine deaminase-like pyridoxal phosphate-dependent protein